MKAFFIVVFVIFPVIVSVIHVLFMSFMFWRKEYKMRARITVIATVIIFNVIFWTIYEVIFLGMLDCIRLFTRKI